MAKLDAKQQIRNNTINNELLYADFLNGTDLDLTNGNKNATITGLKKGTNPNDASTFEQLNEQWQNSVLDVQIDATLVPTLSNGVRYILTDVSNLHANFGTITGVVNGDIVQYDDSAFFVDYTPLKGTHCSSHVKEYGVYEYNGTAWVFYPFNGSEFSRTLFVDAKSGFDDTVAGRGQSGLPYKTLEYAESSITDNVLTVVGDTTSGDATIDGISDVDYAKMEVGQGIEGVGIPIGAIIITLIGGGSDNNSIILSETVTATDTGVSLTLRNEYLIEVNPGGYELVGTLGKLYVNWNFKDGAVIIKKTAGLMINGDSKINIYGLGDFYHYGSGTLYYNHANYTYKDKVFECKNALATSGRTIDLAYGSGEIHATALKSTADTCVRLQYTVNFNIQVNSIVSTTDYGIAISSACTNTKVDCSYVNGAIYGVSGLCYNASFNIAYCNSYNLEAYDSIPKLVINGVCDTLRIFTLYSWHVLGSFIFNGTIVNELILDEDFSGQVEISGDIGTITLNNNFNGEVTVAGNVNTMTATSLASGKVIVLQDIYQATLNGSTEVKCDTISRLLMYGGNFFGSADFIDGYYNKIYGGYFEILLKRFGHPSRILIIGASVSGKLIFNETSEIYAPSHINYAINISMANISVEGNLSVIPNTANHTMHVFRLTGGGSIDFKGKIKSENPILRYAAGLIKFYSATFIKDNTSGYDMDYSIIAETSSLNVHVLSGGVNANCGTGELLSAKKWKEKITVTSVATTSISLNDDSGTETFSESDTTTYNTEILLAGRLTSLINASGTLDITATDNGDGTFDVESDTAGIPCISSSLSNCSSELLRYNSYAITDVTGGSIIENTAIDF